MFKSNIIAGAMVLVSALPAAAQTQSNPDLDEIRNFVQYIMSLGSHGAHKF